MRNLWFVLIGVAGLALMLIPNLPPSQQAEDGPVLLVLLDPRTPHDEVVLHLSQQAGAVTELIDITLRGADGQLVALSKIVLGWTDDSTGNWDCSLNYFPNPGADELASPALQGSEAWVPAKPVAFQRLIDVYNRDAYLPAGITTTIHAQASRSLVGAVDEAFGASCFHDTRIEDSQTEVVLAPARVVVGVGQMPRQITTHESYQVQVPATWISKEARNTVVSFGFGEKRALFGDSRSATSLNGVVASSLDSQYRFSDTDRRRLNDILFAVGTLLVGALLGMISTRARNERSVSPATLAVPGEDNPPAGFMPAFVILLLGLVSAAGMLIARIPRRRL